MQLVAFRNHFFHSLDTITFKEEARQEPIGNVIRQGLLYLDGRNSQKYLQDQADF